MSAEALLLHGLLLAMLVGAVGVDLQRQRIPNLLTFGGTLLGLLGAGVILGAGGLGAAAAGLITGFVLLLPFHLAGRMGAGDVKLLAASGSFLGAASTVDAALFTVAAGGIYGLLALCWVDGPLETVKRYAFGLKHLILSRKWLASRPPADDGRPLRFPYAIAIASGVLLALIWPLLGDGRLLVS